ncbi:MAG: YdcF family protein [Pedosphaera sp.]|nr:YdcF family protein [Pedosphaera sp.]
MEQFISSFTEPLSIVWLLTLAGFGCAVRKRQWTSALWLAVIAISMSVAGSQLSARLLASLERPYSQVDLDGLPVCDAVVVLGGMAGPVDLKPFRLDLSSRADRAVTGMELVRRGKTKTLIFGGGGGKLTDGKPWSEGILLEGWARSWGMVGTNLISLEVCANTHEEALQVRDLVKKYQWKNILLVTSASHMRRSEALFRSHGIQVVPVAADFPGLSSLSRQSPFRITPRLTHLEHLELFLHEQIGWWYYSLRGRIR